MHDCNIMLQKRKQRNVVFSPVTEPFQPHWLCRRLSFLSSFYRATLCISAVFAVGRCLSVRPSVTLVHCIQTAEDIVKLLSRAGSPIILVFWPRRAVPNTKGT